MKKILVALLLAVVFMVSPVNAGITVENYLKYKDSNKIEKEIAETYVLGIGEGITWASASVERLYGKPLFCASKQLAPARESYVNILDIQIKNLQTFIEIKELMDKDILGMLLLNGIEEIFLCKEQQ